MTVPVRAASALPDPEHNTGLGRAYNKPAYRYIRASDRLPSTDAAYEQGLDAVCLVKLFNPTGIGTWWIAGYDPDTRLAYGVAHLFERERGDFSMDELVAFRGRPFGLPLERDIHYEPRTIREVLEEG